LNLERENIKQTDYTDYTTWLTGV